MSYTKGQLANSALEEIGIASYEFDVQPEMIQSVISRLDMMMAEWSIHGLNLSFPIAKEEYSSPDDDSNIPDWSWEAVVTNLAIRIAPSYGKSVSPTTMAIAKRGYSSLCNIFAKPKEMKFTSMPKGAGYKNTGNPFTSSPEDEYLERDDEDIDLRGVPDGL